jgi:hypothetical protein
MATYNKINNFAEQVLLAAYQLNTDTLKLALSRDTDPPVASNTILTDITQPTGTGYTAGGEDVQNTVTESPAGTGVLQGVSFMWTNSHASAPWQSFQYPVLYDDTHASDHLIAWWDYGSALVLNAGETFSARFSNSAVGVAGNIFTLT